MELTHQEYPALLTSLKPNQAVSVLNDRVKLIGKINTDIGDWLSERRRVEDAYVQGLRRLAARKHDVSNGLGVFQIPWRNIVAACDALADSHEVLAQKMEVDVERPLREYQSKSREMQGISTIQGNLGALAKELDQAHQKMEKLRGKGTRSDTSRISSAQTNVNTAMQQWDSQAPFVYEQLQALDEHRVNHLRDALTQLQTHEIDQLERSRASAESALNALLNVDTSDEISTFVARTQGSGGPPSLLSPRTANRPSTSNATNATTPVSPATPLSSRRNNTSSNPAPSVSVDDEHETVPTPRLQTPVAEKQKKSGFSGLKRIGTVMRRNKEPKQTEKAPPTPDKRTRSSLNPLRRGSSARNMQMIPSPNTSMTELADTSARHTPPSRDQNLSRTTSTDHPRVPEEANGHVDGQAASSQQLPNGSQADQEAAEERKPRPPSTIVEEGESGPSTAKPSSAIEDITRAQQEAAATSEMDGPQFKLDIRNQPIQEEDSDAAKALSDTANILRAQAQPPQRKLGTTRGRRDVRNTIFVPNPSSENLPVGDPGIGLPPISPYAKATVDDHRGADAQSVRSAHSLSSLSAGTAVKHPEMAGPGLNASIVETVAAWFENGAITKSIVIGELALVNHASSLTETSTSIRLENFPVLEKVAPNPTFIDSVPSKSGEYKLDLSQISKPQVAFKYQVHLDDTIASQGAHVPISLSANWKAEPTQISVILNYGFNPLFLSSTSPRQVNLSNVVVIVTVEGAKSITCQSKPMGTYSKERNLIYWRLGDLNLREEDGGLKLLARFSTESEAKPGNIEARWEVIGDNAAGLGSGLGIARVAEKSEGMGTADPFADNGTEKKEEWADVKVVRKLVSGKYVAH